MTTTDPRSALALPPLPSREDLVAALAKERAARASVEAALEASLVARARAERDLERVWLDLQRLRVHLFGVRRGPDPGAALPS